MSIETVPREIDIGEDTPPDPGTKASVNEPEELVAVGFGDTRGGNRRAVVLKTVHKVVDVVGQWVSDGHDYGVGLAEGEGLAAVHGFVGCCAHCVAV